MDNITRVTDITEAELQCLYQANLSIQDKMAKCGERFKHLFENLLPNTSLQSYQIVMLVVYIAMIFIGLIGNSIIIGTILSLKREKRNYYILNLAISDFLLCTITQPLNLIRLHDKYLRWISWNIHLCRFITFFQSVNIFICSFSICAISLDRYFLIIHAVKKEVTMKFVKWYILLIWVLGLSLTSPLLHSIKSDNNCSEDSSRSKIIYSVLVSVIQFILPICIVLFANVCIAISIHRRTSKMKKLTSRKHNPELIVLQKANSVNLDDNNSQERSFSLRNDISSSVRRNRSRRANFILALIVVIFALSWIPLIVVNILHDIQLFSGTLITRLQGKIFDIQCICLLMTLLSTCFNPVLYGWLNENFKIGFTKLIKCKQNASPPLTTTACISYDPSRKRNASQSPREISNTQPIVSFLKPDKSTIQLAPIDV